MQVHGKLADGQRDRLGVRAVEADAGGQPAGLAARSVNVQPGLNRAVDVPPPVSGATCGS